MYVIKIDSAKQMCLHLKSTVLQLWHTTVVVNT